ncbi:hypothetical protein AB6A40_009988 [Gnathostoma spinigerum]|uniref:Serpin domain-containing protein n=1 Tax=Gnathostoma spinigerum TaxID=75299 RepID=A0ABD6ETH4_9BILA
MVNLTAGDRFGHHIRFLNDLPRQVNYDGEGQLSEAEMLLLTQKRFTYKQPFLMSLKTNYEAVEKKYNFTKPKARENAATETEEWVKTATGDFVVGTVQKEMFRAETRSSPISALYTVFKWKNPLTKASGEFSGKQINFLKGTGEYLYKTTAKYEMLGMEMTDDAATLYIFLPKGDYATFEKDMDGARVLIGEYAGKTTVEVEIPEVKIFSKYKFNAALQKLGIQKIFTKDAELGDIAEESLSMYASYQAVGFEVNENGVSGGATGTASLQAISGSAETPVEKHTEAGNNDYEEGKGVTKKFVANRPFFFALVRKKIILYAGRYL